MHAQESVGEYATREIGAKFALHEASYRRVLITSAGEEGLDVFSNDLVEQGLLRLVTLVLDGGSSPSGPGEARGTPEQRGRARSVPILRGTWKAGRSIKGSPSPVEVAFLARC
jgi:hypothetical protein